MKILRFILNLLLLAAIGYVGYMLYKTIEEPIIFEREKEKRDVVTIEKLKKIRSAQLAFKNLHGDFAPNFDTLVTVIKTGQFDVLKQIGDPNDSTVVVKTEVTKRPIIDSLFDNNAAYVDSLRFVPYSDQKEEFYVKAKRITKNEVEVPAFEVGVPYETLYTGLVDKYYNQLKGRKMRVGSITEGTTSGSWDK